MAGTDKKPAINYTSRDFNSIKTDLVEYAKRYYPAEFKDFSANSFGSLLLDTVSYVGDMLSFYLDYQVNESFLTTAIERKNILKIAQQLGHKPKLTTVSYGDLTFFILIPANSSGAPNFNYAPILKAGSLFKTRDGKSFFLLENVNFKDQANNEIVVGNVDRQTGAPLNYAVRARGQAVSGKFYVKQVRVGAYEKFRKIQILDNNITEIVSVSDGAGNPYYEVDYLSQDVVYIPIINRNADRRTVPNIMKPISVPRRYTVVVEDGSVYLQFGGGTNENVEEVLDPANVFIERHGKQYVIDDSFDPNSLTETDTLGVSPSNTVLTIVYRKNDFASANTGIGTINIVEDAVFDFDSALSLNPRSVLNVEQSLEVINERQFIGSNDFTTNDQIRERAFGAYSMQNRIVTKQDFMTAAYNMPSRFGAIRKVSVAQDADSFNQRNINLYVLSEDANGSLSPANNTVKTNLKSYLSKYKMMNDTVDILDGRVVNLKIDFKIITYPDTNKFAALDSAKESLVGFFRNRKNFDIGEPFKMSDIFNVLKNNPLVLDVEEVQVATKTGAGYADTNFVVEDNKNRSGRLITCPEDTVFEVRFPSSDIVGTVR